MKKLIPAIVMVLICAVTLSTASFAWFSMNTQVTATGMQVTAKSDNTYLLISSTETTAANIQADGLKTVALNVDAKVFPSAPAISAAELAYLTTAGKDVSGATIVTEGVKVENQATAGAATNWYTASALASDAADIDAATARQLTTAAFGDYVIKKTVSLTVAKGANAADALTVTPNFTKKVGGTDISAARVLVATSDDGFAILDSSDNGTKVDIKGSDTDLTDTTVLTIDIYIYYDGNDTNVYTENAANLADASFDLAFDVVPVPAP